MTAIQDGATTSAPVGDADALLDALVARFGAPIDSRIRPSDRIAAIEESADDPASIERARQLQAALFDAGYGWLSGPAEYGGRGLSAEECAAFDEILVRRGLPSRAPLFVGLHIVAPAILAHGSPELRERFLPGLFSGRVLGCQLFSEPGAGSDLAAVSTRAVRDGDHWILNGQKVWTSWAHVADIGEVLVRTDPEASKHAGLSMFVLDMNTPGVTVRPLRQATGGAAFNEVFLDDVRLPDANRIGAEGEGWKVANTSLSSERGSMASSDGPISPFVLARLRALLERELAANPGARQEVARALTAIVAALVSFDTQPSEWERGLGRAAASIQKLLMVRAVDAVAAAAEAVLGARAHIDTGQPDTFAWSEFVLGGPGIHLAGGTDEIQRTLIAQLGLDFPRPPRAGR